MKKNHSKIAFITLGVATLCSVGTGAGFILYNNSKESNDVKNQSTSLETQVDATGNLAAIVEEGPTISLKEVLEKENKLTKNLVKKLISEYLVNKIVAEEVKKKRPLTLPELQQYIDMRKTLIQELDLQKSSPSSSLADTSPHYYIQNVKILVEGFIKEVEKYTDENKNRVVSDWTKIIQSKTTQLLLELAVPPLDINKIRTQRNALMFILPLEALEDDQVSVIKAANDAINKANKATLLKRLEEKTDEVEKLIIGDYIEKLDKPRSELRTLIDSITFVDFEAQLKISKGEETWRQAGYLMDVLTHKADVELKTIALTVALFDNNVENIQSARDDLFNYLENTAFSDHKRLVDPLKNARIVLAKGDEALRVLGLVSEIQTKERALHNALANGESVSDLRRAKEDLENFLLTVPQTNIRIAPYISIAEGQISEASKALQFIKRIEDATKELNDFIATGTSTLVELQVARNKLYAITSNINSTFKIYQKPLDRAQAAFTLVDAEINALKHVPTVIAKTKELRDSFVDGRIDEITFLQNRLVNYLTIIPSTHRRLVESVSDANAAILEASEIITIIENIRNIILSNIDTSSIDALLTKRNQISEAIKTITPNTKALREVIKQGNEEIHILDTQIEEQHFTYNLEQKAKALEVAIATGKINVITAEQKNLTDYLTENMLHSKYVLRISTKYFEIAKQAEAMIQLDYETGEINAVRKELTKLTDALAEANKLEISHSTTENLVTLWNAHYHLSNYVDGVSKENYKYDDVLKRANGELAKVSADNIRIGKENFQTWVSYVNAQITLLRTAYDERDIKKIEKTYLLLDWAKTWSFAKRVGAETIFPRIERVLTHVATAIADINAARAYTFDYSEVPEDTTKLSNERNTLLIETAQKLYRAMERYDLDLVKQRKVELTDLLSKTAKNNPLVTIGINNALLAITNSEARIAELEYMILVNDKVKILLKELRAKNASAVVIARDDLVNELKAELAKDVALTITVRNARNVLAMVPSVLTFNEWKNSLQTKMTAFENLLNGFDLDATIAAKAELELLFETVPRFNRDIRNLIDQGSQLLIQNEEKIVAQRTWVMIIKLQDADKVKDLIEIRKLRNELRDFLETINGDIKTDWLKSTIKVANARIREARVTLAFEDMVIENTALRRAMGSRKSDEIQKRIDALTSILEAKMYRGDQEVTLRVVSDSRAKIKAAKKIILENKIIDAVGGLNWALQSTDKVLVTKTRDDLKLIIENLPEGIDFSHLKPTALAHIARADTFLIGESNPTPGPSTPSVPSTPSGPSTPSEPGTATVVEEENKETVSRLRALITSVNVARALNDQVALDKATNELRAYIATITIVRTDEIQQLITDANTALTEIERAPTAEEQENEKIVAKLVNLIQGVDAAKNLEYQSLIKTTKTALREFTATIIDVRTVDIKQLILQAYGLLIEGTNIPSTPVVPETPSTPPTTPTTPPTTPETPKTVEEENQETVRTLKSSLNRITVLKALGDHVSLTKAKKELSAFIKTITIVRTDEIQQLITDANTALTEIERITTPKN